MRARGDAPALHPARIPADRRDGGGRIEAPRGASAVGTQHIAAPRPDPRQPERDRKSTRLNSSHTVISYAVFCLKKKKIQTVASYHHLHITNTRTDVMSTEQNAL